MTKKYMFHIQEREQQALNSYLTIFQNTDGLSDPVGKMVAWDNIKKQNARLELIAELLKEMR